MIQESKAWKARVKMAINSMRVEKMRAEPIPFDPDALSDEVDKLACEPYPRERVAIPVDGQRCPRCHRRIRAGWRHPCALCNPMAVPTELYDVLVLRPQG